MFFLAHHSSKCRHQYASPIQGRACKQLYLRSPGTWPPNNANCVCFLIIQRADFSHWPEASGSGGSLVVFCLAFDRYLASCLLLPGRQKGGNGARQPTPTVSVSSLRLANRFGWRRSAFLPDKGIPGNKCCQCTPNDRLQTRHDTDIYMILYTQCKSILTK